MYHISRLLVNIYNIGFCISSFWDIWSLKNLKTKLIYYLIKLWRFKQKSSFRDSNNSNNLHFIVFLIFLCNKVNLYIRLRCAADGAGSADRRRQAGRLRKMAVAGVDQRVNLVRNLFQKQMRRRPDLRSSRSHRSSLPTRVSPLDLRPPKCRPQCRNCC